MDNRSPHFEDFKEKLCQVGFIDTMQVIWGYMRNLQFNKEIPSDIELPPKYDIHSDVNLRRLNGIGEWEFDLILFYSILLSPKNTIPRYSLKEFKNLGSVVNDIRKIRDELEGTLKNDKDRVSREFFRVMHRQFPWQENINIFYTYRFYKIFSHPTLNELIYKKTGLSIKELYMCGILITGYFNNYFCSKTQIKSTVTGITDAMLNSFIKFFSIQTEEFIKKYKSTYTIDDSFLYNFNPVRSYPILIHKSNFYCPIPTYLFWKMTNGIYYDIVNEKGFDNAIGESFEKYCGLVLQKSVTKKSIEVFSEISYGKPIKKSSDWILRERNTILFIECKAKRLRLGSKVFLTKSDDIEKDLLKMKDFLVQTYKAANEAIENKIPGIICKEHTKLYILVLTLEEWFVSFNPTIDQKIRQMVSTELGSLGLSDTLIDKYPYFITSISSFERDCQVINKFGLGKFYDKMVLNEVQELKKGFKYKEIFEGDFDKEFFSNLSN